MPDPRAAHARQTLTLDDVRNDGEVQVFVRKADENLGVLGYTEHGPRHCGIVAGIAKSVLLRLGYPPRTAELAAIAGYLHDIGNGINRLDHGIGAALLSRHILERLGMGPDEYAEVMCAIGNHEEEYGQAVSPLAAAVILGDKSDVHRSRVRVIDPETDDIHDRVNMATTRSYLAVDAEAQHHHAGARHRHRDHPGDAVLRDLPRQDGDVPAGGRVPGLPVRHRDQRDAPALDRASRTGGVDAPRSSEILDATSDRRWTVGMKRRGGFLVGALAGVVAGLFLAPKSGRETREQLFGQGGFGGQVDRIKGALGAGKDSAADQNEALRRKIEETRERLRSQMDAGGNGVGGEDAYGGPAGTAPGDAS